MNVRMEPPMPNQPTFEIELSWDEAVRLVNGRRFMRTMEPDLVLDTYKDLGDELESQILAYAPRTRLLHENRVTQ